MLGEISENAIEAAEVECPARGHGVEIKEGMSAESAINGAAGRDWQGGIVLDRVV